MELTNQCLSYCEMCVLPSIFGIACHILIVLIWEATKRIPTSLGSAIVSVTYCTMCSEYASWRTVSTLTCYLESNSCLQANNIAFTFTSVRLETTFKSNESSYSRGVYGSCYICCQFVKICALLFSHMTYIWHIIKPTFHHKANPFIQQSVCYYPTLAN